MFCTNCGFENPPLHRFCGMCGTPLPQRPITAPGAHSTVGLTRLPVEVPQPNASTVANVSNASAIDIAEAQPSGTAGSTYFSQAEQAESLEQFIAGFRYTPPAEEDEVTMTGNKPVLDSTTTYESPAPISVSEEETPLAGTPLNTAEPLQTQTTAVEDAAPMESTVEQPPAVVTEPPPFATKGIREQAPKRSSFLDFSEPAEQSSSDATANIGGPSFLGLSDSPATPAYIADDSVTRQSHWRAWAALIVIGIFAALGILEWRAEQRQSSNGPIGIMKMQIERLKGKKGAVITPPPSEAATEPAQPNSTTRPSGSGPEMQVAPSQKSQPTAPQPDKNGNPSPEKAAAPGTASNVPATTQPSPIETSSTSKNASSGGPKSQATPAKAESANSTKAKRADNSSNSTGQNAETAESKAETPAKTAPGAEELAKAANASDAAAASAWLWKSVAKGNPEAPIKLANMYIKGDGVPQSCDQAMVLLRSAAAKENAPARSRLGALYATGTCVPRNRVRAYEYMSQAVEANPNAAWARDFRKQLWEQMTPQERSEAQKSR